MPAFYIMSSPLTDPNTISKIVGKIADDPTKVIDILGLYSYSIFFAAAIILLFTAQRYITLAFYVVGYYLTEVIVRLLKGALRIPRPVGYIPFMGETSATLERAGHKYGFPSGHSTAAAYTLSFMWFGARRIATPAFFYVGALLFGAALYQRWIYRRHTIAQLGAGAILGAFLGWVAVGASRRATEGVTIA